VMGTVRRVCRNVKRWRSASMARRWIAAAMQEAAKGFRRPKAHNTSPPLRSRASPWHRQNAEVPKRPRAIVCASTALAGSARGARSCAGSPWRAPSSRR
jgi:hypothetical protein